MLVHRIAGGLHHKHIYAAHIFEQLEVNFAIREPLQLGVAHLDSDVLADLLSQRAVGRPAEELETAILAQVAGPLVFGGWFAALQLGRILGRGLFRIFWGPIARLIGSACWWLLVFR